MEFIFRRFLKEERNLSRISEGSGLGLSIAQGLAEIMGDKIVVESEVGKGSCFSVNITLKDWIGSVPSADNWSETLKSKGDLCILVAEDDSANFYYMNALIRRELNARVIHATNGKEAVELFISNPDINLVLMDIKMPVMDGLEATRQIKAIKKQIPVIAVTAYAMSGDEERVLAAGCDNYLSKPISKKDLLAAVARYF
jgi:CheY-like chemotaxis protein